MLAFEIKKNQFELVLWWSVWVIWDHSSVSIILELNMISFFLQKGWFSDEVKNSLFLDSIILNLHKTQIRFLKFQAPKFSTAKRFDYFIPHTNKWINRIESKESPKNTFRKFQFAKVPLHREKLEYRKSLGTRICYERIWNFVTIFDSWNWRYIEIFELLLKIQSCCGIKVSVYFWRQKSRSMSGMLLTLKVIDEVKFYK